MCSSDWVANDLLGGLAAKQEGALYRAMDLCDTRETVKDMPCKVTDGKKTCGSFDQCVAIRPVAASMLPLLAVAYAVHTCC